MTSLVLEKLESADPEVNPPQALRLAGLKPPHGIESFSFQCR